jgi:membrane fusion protein (multidrug efflux system)
MFAQVEVLNGGPREVLAVPSTSVLYAPFGDSVYVVEPQGEGAKAGLVARQRFVRLGERRGDLVTVVSGLKSGETIVSTGAFKLRNGAAVAIAEAPRAVTEEGPDGAARGTP